MASSFLRTFAISCGSSLHGRSGSSKRLKRLENQALMFHSRLPEKSLRSSLTEIVSMAAEGTEAPTTSDASAPEVSSPPQLSGSKVVLPPRICTLREFGEGMIAVDSNQEAPSFFEMLAANIEFSNNVQNWEILSGRLAMMVFASAVLVEAVTGNSVFEKMDPQRLLEIFGAILASAVIAAGFAVALQAKTKVAFTVSKGYERMLNALIDKVFDSLLFDEEN
ncbi:hypothetical protein KP509_36G024100 [Ceratopteris richardii]|uniref:Uncharacterized protein n=1 Tax=Ceratopteris richardii TaxID=49495 RepID=A0A8T2QA62_CERRI|nr:hypothetical protein KP509_36G024100 [Ceratopteris richardii]